MDLPTFEEARAAVRAGRASPLQHFIYSYEPNADDDRWRAHLSHVVRDALGQAVPHDNENKSGRQVASICLTDGDRVAMRLAPGGLGYRQFALLVGYLLHNVAAMYRVPVHEVRNCMDMELQAADTSEVPKRLN